MLCDLGNYELSAGNLDAARRHLAEALDIARALNARDGIAYAIFYLGLAEYLAGSLSSAGTLFTESLDLASRTGMKRHTAYALIGLALAVRGGPDPGWSARLLGRWKASWPTSTASACAPRWGAKAFEGEYGAGRTLTPSRSLISRSASGPDAVC